MEPGASVVQALNFPLLCSYFLDLEAATRVSRLGMVRLSPPSRHSHFYA